MMSHQLAKRERALSLWIEGRLHERAAVDWAVKALKKIRGELGNEELDLFAFLDSHAAKQIELASDIKKLWHLLHIAAQQSSGPFGRHLSFELHQEIQADHIRPETINKIVEWLRPRLTAEQLSPWAGERVQVREGTEQPLRWVHWSFKARAGSLADLSLNVGRREFEWFPTDLLLRLVEKSTDALIEAYSVAEDVGWLDNGVDLPNLHVHRVVKRADSDGDDDPDAFDDRFAPLTRTLSESLSCLAQRNSLAAKRVVDRWDEQKGDLFLRLSAFARWDPDFLPIEKVEPFLEKISDGAFWRWNSYPEIASLRALRWKEFPADFRSHVEHRLIDGPPSDMFGDGQGRESTIRYFRDHELARIFDCGGELSETSRNLVEARRKNDNDFPVHVPSIEPGMDGVRAIEVPDGEPSKYDDISDAELLDALRRSKDHRDFGQGDDAEAFAKTGEGKKRLLGVLESADSVVSDATKTGWRLLLSYPSSTEDDVEVGRATCERVAGLALRQNSSLIAELSDQLSYWLDYAEAAYPKFEGSDELWLKLLPTASEHANGISTDESDLTGAALNEPLGHLVSLFLRRCPPLPSDEAKVLPEKFATPLRGLAGRAREIMANRMAIHIRYFWIADSGWTEQFVIKPMLLGGREGARLWEAFTKYGQVPQSEIWSMLEQLAMRRLVSGELSPEARRRLAEMAIVVWSWSKKPPSSYALKAADLRSALELADNDLRSHVAWYFQHILDSSHKQAADTEAAWPILGKSFFGEIWPLESELQSSQSSNHFAGIPAKAGERYYVAAIETILPYMRPFEVWSIRTEFWPGTDNSKMLELIEKHPEETLKLLSASIDLKKPHPIVELREVLDTIVVGSPLLERDSRLRALRRFSLN